MRYVKMFVMECLEGTIRFDFEPDERSVWYDLIILGGRMRTKGLISAGPGKPYPRPYIAGVLNISTELLDRTLAKCIATGRLEENADGIRIINWAKYQSEYDRQKPYRESKRERQKRLEAEGKCPICGEEGHNKYSCPNSRFPRTIPG
jgi:hypothetical protein